MEAFDHIAKDYDDAFTRSSIGKAQRDRVWYFLNKIIDEKKISNVLELNCGTGVDALRLSQKVRQVLATDISSAMIKVASEKAAANNISNVSFQNISINNLHPIEDKFDMIFSNFGGLNCLSPTEITQAAKQISNLMTENGIFVAVIMARFSWWESFYFFLKRKWKNIFRRKSNKAIQARLNEHTFIDTYYYNPNEFYGLMGNAFNYKKSNSVGYFLPPSYLESFFVKRPKLLSFLNKLEYLVPSGALFSGASDHYILQLEKKV